METRPKRTCDYGFKLYILHQIIFDFNMIFAYKVILMEKIRRKT